MTDTRNIYVLDGDPKGSDPYVLVGYVVKTEVVTDGFHVSDASLSASGKVDRLVTGNLQGTPSFVISVDGERQVTSKSTSLVDDDTFTVTGEGDRVRVGSGNLVYDNNIAIAAVGERQIVLNNGISGQANPTLTASGHRTITSSSTIGNNASLSGAGEREIVSSNNSLIVDNTFTTSVLERQITSPTNALVYNGVFSASAVAEREITTDISLSYNGVFAISGTSARQITATSIEIQNNHTLSGVGVKEVVSSNNSLTLDSFEITSIIATRSVILVASTLQSDNSAISAIVERSVTSSSTLTSSDASISADIERGLTGSGSLVADSVFVIDGTAKTNRKSTSANLQASNNVVATNPSGVHTVVGISGFESGNNEVIGSGQRGVGSFSNNELIQDAITITSSLEREITSPSNDLVYNGIFELDGVGFPSKSIFGDLVPTLIASSGAGLRTININSGIDVSTDFFVISTVGIREVKSVGNNLLLDLEVAGQIDRVRTGSGSFVSDIASVAGQLERNHVGVGTLDFADDTILSVTAIGERETKLDSVISSPDYVLSSVGTRQVTSANNQLVNNISVQGTGVRAITDDGLGLHGNLILRMAGVVERSMTTIVSDLQSTIITLSGVGERSATTNVSLQLSNCSLSGAGNRIVTIDDAFRVSDNIVAGLGERSPTVVADILLDDFTLTATGLRTIKTESDIVLDANLTGTGTRTVKVESASLIVNDIQMTSDEGYRIVVSGPSQMLARPMTINNLGFRTSFFTGILNQETGSISAVVEREVKSISADLSTETVVSGVAERSIGSSGSLTSDITTISGIGTRQTVAYGNLYYDNVFEVSGTTEREVVSASNVLINVDNILSGVGKREVIVAGSLIGTTTFGYGIGERQITSNFNYLPYESAQLTGGGKRTITGSGSAVADNSSASGSSIRQTKANSGLVPTPITLFAGLTKETKGTGSVVSNQSQVLSAGQRKVISISGNIATPRNTRIEGRLERSISVIGMSGTSNSVFSGAGLKIDSRLTSGVNGIANSSLIAIGEVVNVDGVINPINTDQRVLTVSIDVDGVTATPINTDQRVLTVSIDVDTTITTRVKDSA